MDNNLVEAKRWFEQARYDIRAAKNSLSCESYEWACFQAQQGGEKFLKAYLYSKGLRAILTHSLKDLILECRNFDESFNEILENGRFLDMYYIPTRYPNNLPGTNIPAKFYTKEDAEKCISCAEQILKKVRKFIEE